MKWTSLLFPQNLFIREKLKAFRLVCQQSMVRNVSKPIDEKIYENGMVVLRGVPAALVLETIRRILYWCNSLYRSLLMSYFWLKFEPYLSLQFLSAEVVLASYTKLRNIIKSGPKIFKGKQFCTLSSMNHCGGAGLELQVIIYRM